MTLGIKLTKTTQQMRNGGGGGGGRERNKNKKQPATFIPLPYNPFF